MHTVVEEPAVKDAVDAACARWARAGEAWEAIVWALARDPKVGLAVTESGNVRALVSDGARSIGLPTVRVLYEISRSAIVIHEAEFRESAHVQAGRA